MFLTSPDIIIAICQLYSASEIISRLLGQLKIDACLVSQEWRQELRGNFLTTEPDTHALYNISESFYHERSTKEPTYHRDTSAKRLITTTTTVVLFCSRLCFGLHNDKYIILIHFRSKLTILQNVRMIN